MNRTNFILSYIRGNMVSRLTAEYCVWFCVPGSRGLWRSWRATVEGHKRVIVDIMHGEKMRDLSLVGLGKRRQRDGLKAADNCVKSCYKGSRVKLS